MTPREEVEELNITQHAVERSIERLNLTGVELYNLIKKKVKPHRFKQKRSYYIYVKHKPNSFKLAMNRMNVVTILIL